MCVCAATYARTVARIRIARDAFPSAFVSLNSLGADRAVAAHALFADTVDSSKTHVHIPLSSPINNGFDIR